MQNQFRDQPVSFFLLFNFLRICYFHNIVISLKASDVNRTVEAYRMLSKQVDYPLHLGITEAGTPKSGTVKSAIGLDILLNEGIGDTLRVSLTADPTEEIRVGWDILKSLELRKRGVNFVSCPTCGRTEINLIDLANRVEAELAKIDKRIERFRKLRHFWEQHD